MSKDVFSSTLRRFVLYITIIVVLFSSIIIFQSGYSIINNQQLTAQKFQPIVQNEIDNLKTSLYSNLSSSALNAQAYLNDALERLSTLSGMMICVFDEHGRVLAYAPRVEQFEGNLDNKGSALLLYLPEQSGYMSFFSNEKDYFRNNKFFKNFIKEDNPISRSYVFIDVYNTSRVNLEQTHYIAICISSFKHVERNLLFKSLNYAFTHNSLHFIFNSSYSHLC